MSHDYHDILPGYSPNQIWHDGCGECEMRGANPAMGINALDAGNFRRAWARSREWDGVGLADLSECEMDLLRILSSIRNKVGQVFAAESVAP